MTNGYPDTCLRCRQIFSPTNSEGLMGIQFCPQCKELISQFLSKKDTWSKQAVDGRWSSASQIDHLESELGHILSEAKDEKPLQKFFENNPGLLCHLYRSAHGGWIFPQPKFGSEYVPDFMVCGLNSAGPHWHLIELENPNYLVLTKKGQPTAKFTHAMQQVRDWRIWLRKNIQYAQNQLGYIGLDSEFEAIVVMGRRKDLNPEHHEKYRELSNEKVQVMSYDRMVEYTIGGARSLCQTLDNLTKSN